LIGLPLQTSIPHIKNLRWRYCNRWNEEPAAKLGSSLLRLDICHLADWCGSAVDFVEKGFQRFAKANGADVVRRVWDGELIIMDSPFELTAHLMIVLKTAYRGTYGCCNWVFGTNLAMVSFRNSSEKWV
jgi:hypothetical protein